MKQVSPRQPTPRAAPRAIQRTPGGVQNGQVAVMEAQGPQVPLPAKFYEPSASVVAPLLLGHWLVRNTPGGPSGGIIVETEAYLAHDPSCHGYQRETPRNRAMYGPPGRAYVYFIYGNHWCFNAVCRPAGVAEAVLIRAIEPRFGVDWMQANRPVAWPHDLTNGPAKCCAALQIDRTLDATDLCDPESPVFIAENPQHKLLLAELGPMVTTRRIGITRAADWPLRFYLEGSRFVSRRVRPPLRPLGGQRRKTRS